MTGFEASTPTTAQPAGGRQTGGPSGGGLPSLLLVVLGAAGFAASLTAVYRGMRDVMVNSGGYCASGGPYQINPGQVCQSGQVWLLMGGVFAGLFFAAVLVGASGRWGGWRLSGVGLLMWAALFGSLGWNFIDLGVDPPPNTGGAAGWIFCGVIFWLMALGGLIPGVIAVVSYFRNADKPESVSSSFSPPLVRANVDFERTVPGYAVASDAPPSGGRARAWGWLAATLLGSAGGVALGIVLSGAVLG